MTTPIARPPVARPPIAMTIAGSDSGGGAGIQADLKTFAALGVYGASTLTAITAQNTVGVTAVHEIPTDIITAQIDAVLTDIGADAVKTGMLSSPAIVRAVAAAVKRHRITRLVVDPVMVAKSGDRLLRQEAVATIRDTLLPLAAVVTPNIPEAQDLTGLDIAGDAAARAAAEAIIKMGARSVVIKGGHRSGPPPTCSTTAAGFGSTPRSASPRSTPTAPAAPSPPPSPPAWPTAWMFPPPSGRPSSMSPPPFAPPTPSDGGTAPCTTSIPSGRKPLLPPATARRLSLKSDIPGSGSPPPFPPGPDVAKA